MEVETSEVCVRVFPSTHSITYHGARTQTRSPAVLAPLPRASPPPLPPELRRAQKKPDERLAELELGRTGARTQNERTKTIFERCMSTGISGTCAPEYRAT